MPTKKPTKARIVFHGVDAPDYFQGHGVSFTKYTDCATGIGHSSKEAFFDALEQLATAGEWDIDGLETLEAFDGTPFGDSLACLTDEVPTEVKEQDGSGELYVYVSIDVA